VTSRFSAPGWPSSIVRLQTFGHFQTGVAEKSAFDLQLFKNSTSMTSTPSMPRDAPPSPEWHPSSTQVNRPGVLGVLNVTPRCFAISAECDLFKLAAKHISITFGIAAGTLLGKQP